MVGWLVCFSVEGVCFWLCLLFDRVNGGVYFIVWFSFGCFRAFPFSRWRADVKVLALLSGELLIRLRA